MSTPIDVLGTLLDYIFVIVSFTNSSLSIRCFRKTNETLKNCTSCTSDFTVNVKDQNMNFVAVTTCRRCVRRSTRTTSNIYPVQTRQILTLSVLITNRGNSDISVICIFNNNICSKLNTTLIQSNQQFTLNTRSRNSSSISSLSYSLSSSDDTSDTTRRKTNFKFLVGRIPCKNIYTLSTRDFNGGSNTRGEITNNVLNSQNDAILEDFTSSTTSSTSNSLISNKLVLVT